MQFAGPGGGAQCSSPGPGVGLLKPLSSIPGIPDFVLSRRRPFPGPGDGAQRTWPGMPLMSCRSWVFLYRPLSRCNFDARDSWREWVYTLPDPAPAFTRAYPQDAYSFAAGRAYLTDLGPSITLFQTPRESPTHVRDFSDSPTGGTTSPPAGRNTR